MNSTIASIDAFDRSLRSEYARFAGDLPGQPESLVQRRFAQYGVFPGLGWALIGVGEAQALATNDAAIRYGALARFVKCAHGCWGAADEQGFHPGGYDYCSLSGARSGLLAVQQRRMRTHLSDISYTGTRRRADEVAVHASVSIGA